MCMNQPKIVYKKKKKGMGIACTYANGLPSSLTQASFLWNLTDLIQALAPPLGSWPWPGQLTAPSFRLLLCKTRVTTASHLIRLLEGVRDVLQIGHSTKWKKRRQSIGRDSEAKSLWKWFSPPAFSFRKVHTWSPLTEPSQVRHMLEGPSEACPLPTHWLTGWRTLSMRL